MNLRALGFMLALLALQSQSHVESVSVPFIPSMMLGRTFDYSKSAVGVDIYDASVRDNAVVRHVDRSDVKFKMIKSSEDVRDVLDVSGQLSLKVMAGVVDVEGRGSYLKSSIESGNTIEVLAQIYYRTVTKTITDDKQPISGWDSKSIVGQHYIRSITYGGYLIASLKFTAKKTSTKEHIKARLSASLNAGVSLSVKGQFEKLTQAAGDTASMSIYYTSSTIPDLAPINLTTLLTIIDNFPEKIRNTNEGLGVPIKVEIRELGYLTQKTKFKFLENSGNVGPNIERLGKMYHDIMVALNEIRKKLKDARLTDAQETKYGKFYDKIMQTHGIFLETIENLDLNANTASPTQFDAAINAYTEDTNHYLFGKFLRQWRRVRKENPWDPVEIRKNNEKRVKDQQTMQNMEGVIGQLDAETSSFKNLYSGGDVTISFPTQSASTYMIDRGSPEMDSIMACFSGKLTSPRSSSHIISYATTAHDNSFLVYTTRSNARLTLVDKHKYYDINTFGMKDGKWHGWCFYWDATGTNNVYKDGKIVYNSQNSRTENMPGGGTWVLGQDQDGIGRNFEEGQAFIGEIRDVNIYGNFDKNYFKTVVGPAVSSSNTCNLKYKGNLIKSWDEFKLGFVGNYATMVKSSSCSN
ncbi:Hypothetical predicted protein [Paramuricea clavata]|uniref:Pentraxin (PTX) domain-containing protein n=1 Tax=Paramuricea clavata TaxID=317549 RepID=A0A7D9ETD8_PARCT|nr:Hypothetical predicted protein [Paramuricea clavata]